MLFLSGCQNWHSQNIKLVKDAAFSPANFCQREHLATDLPRLTRSVGPIKEQPFLCSCSPTPVSLISWIWNLPQTHCLHLGAGSPNWVQAGLIQSPRLIDKCPSFHWHLPSGTHAEETQHFAGMSQLCSRGSLLMPPPWEVTTVARKTRSLSSLSLKQMDHTVILWPC